MSVEIIGVEPAGILRRFVHRHKSSHSSPPRLERRRVVEFGCFGKLLAEPMALNGRLEPFEMGFLDKATSMGYECPASFKGVMTFPSAPEKSGFDSKSGCLLRRFLGRNGRHS
jgi:hypothetical protein